jgi:hypothetical protein
MPAVYQHDALARAIKVVCLEPGQGFTTPLNSPFISTHPPEHPATSRQAEEDQQSRNQKQDNRHRIIADEHDRRSAETGY